MNKYTILSISSFVIFFISVVFFKQISVLMGDMIPFISVILFGVLGVVGFILRGAVWYRKDLAKRTLEQLEQLEEKEESA